MKTLIAILLAGLLAITAGTARAGDNAVMVELFTSQGCSSCPPADRALGSLTGRDDILALSLHVDYWNYLGWRDTFAKPEFTARQYAYREHMRSRVVYTPQMVVHGVFDVIGTRTGDLAKAIKGARNAGSGAEIAIAERDGMLVAAIVPDGDPGPATVYVASYLRSATVAIARGENADRTLTYHNVVDDLMRVGPWRGAESQTFSLPQPDTGEGVAIWLQDDETGRILAASFLNR